jgi:archaemetzincin
VPLEIEVLNGSSIRDRDLQRVWRRIEQVFAATVRVRRADLNVAAAYDTSRHQNNSTALLAQILDTADVSRKVIAVVDVDLFIPILTFVFGEAQLGGPAAIVSTHRLHNEFYGLVRDDRLLVQRLEKEVVHELGHTFGLYHCHQFECVMRSSTYVEEIDMKRVEPCTECAAVLRVSELAR